MLLQGQMTVLTGLILSVLMLVLGLAIGSVVAPVKTAKAACGADQGAGLTAESALSAEDGLRRALQDNDADAIPPPGARNPQLIAFLNRPADWVRLSNIQLV
jgi:hypothetical protein